jgi:hypothetical protein
MISLLPINFRYEKEGEPSQLAHVDIYVSTVDPTKEPPLVTANVILSILGVDYPVDKVSCYLSDDGASMLTFDALSETSEFSRKWVPFCKKFNIEPRAPEMYFAQKMDYLKDKVQPTFVKERRAMKVGCITLLLLGLRARCSSTKSSKGKTKFLLCSKSIYETAMCIQEAKIRV